MNMAILPRGALQFVPRSRIVATNFASIAFLGDTADVPRYPLPKGAIHARPLHRL